MNGSQASIQLLEEEILFTIHDPSLPSLLFPDSLQVLSMLPRSLDSPPYILTTMSLPSCILAHLLHHLLLFYHILVPDQDKPDHGIILFKPSVSPPSSGLTLTLHTRHFISATTQSHSHQLLQPPLLSAS